MLKMLENCSMNLHMMYTSFFVLQLYLACSATRSPHGFGVFFVFVLRPLIFMSLPVVRIVFLSPEAQILRCTSHVPLA